MSGPVERMKREEIRGIPCRRLSLASSEQAGFRPGSVRGNVIRKLPFPDGSGNMDGACGRPLAALSVTRDWAGSALFFPPRTGRFAGMAPGAFAELAAGEPAATQEPTRLLKESESQRPRLPFKAWWS